MEKVLKNVCSDLSGRTTRTLPRGVGWLAEELLTEIRPGNSRGNLLSMIGQWISRLISLGSRRSGLHPNLIRNRCHLENPGHHNVLDNPQTCPRLGAFPVLNMVIRAQIVLISKHSRSFMLHIWFLNYLG
jgi:hypothetical protein